MNENVKIGVIGSGSNNYKKLLLSILDVLSKRVDKELDRQDIQIIISDKKPKESISFFKVENSNMDKNVLTNNRNKRKCIILENSDKYLNEPMNYKNIHLQVNTPKKLVKKYNR